MSACPPYPPVSAQVLMPGQSANPTPPQAAPGTPTSLQHGGGGSGSPSAAGTPGMVSAAGLGGPSPVAGGPPPPSHHVCCESGRPMLTDPLTGQTMCSCQYDAQLLNYQRLAASGLPLNMYGTAAAAAAAAAAAYGGDQGFLPLGATEQSAFYSPSANGFDLKENLEAWRSLQPYAASMYYPYESAALAGYPFANGYGVDLNGARRKNATRETTATLKAWLSEHRKNPYPTKGEKIMLAIITKMTLTQVSTWFANARRRLKKENKMTWSPRNRCDDDDDDEDARPSRDAKDSGSVASSGGKSTDGMDSVYRKQAGSHDPSDMSGIHRQYNPHSLHRKEEDDRLKDDLDDLRNGLVDIDDDSKSSDPGLLRGLHHHGHHGHHHRLQGSSAQQRSTRVSSNDKNPGSPGAASDGGSPVASDSESSQTSLLSPSTPVHHDGRGSGGGSSSVTDIQSPSNPKPRIWSIVDTATSGTPGGGQNGIPIPASRAAVDGLSSLQRARLDYLSTYQKQGVGAPSWYGAATGAGPPGGSFPLYACSPMVPTAGLPSGSPANAGHPSVAPQLGSSGPLSGGHSVDTTAAAVAASLNRLRTVHGFGAPNDLSVPGSQGGPGKSNVSSFSFVTSSSRLHPAMTTATSSSGGSSSSAIAAVTGSLGINPMASIASRVVS